MLVDFKEWRQRKPRILLQKKVLAELNHMNILQQTYHKLYVLSEDDC